MCGIVGTASLTPFSDRRLLEQARDTLVHRGPDDAGVWWNTSGTVGFAHRRLSIIDLSPLGHQPMHGPEGQSTIVFNGEIYNYQDLKTELLALGHVFRSTSDTEVILAAYRQWGDDCLARLNGAFAFALLDQSRNHILFARDRAGEKPLYYEHGGGSIRFASELKALLTLNPVTRRIDPLALDCWLAGGYVPGPLSMVQGIQKLPPAHAMAYNLSTASCTVWPYWTLPSYAGPEHESPQAMEARKPALLDELEQLLQDAVGRQMVADVPVGILLSGGVDSSLLTAMAVRSSPRVKTFTIRFPGYGAYDETEHARLVARHFGTEHVELEAAESSVDLLPMLARQFDEPLVDSSIIPTWLVSSLVRQHCTVALGGDGGDELFGGYGTYTTVLGLQQRLSRFPRVLGRLLGAAAETFLPLGMRGRNHLRSYGLPEDSGLLPYGLFDKTARKALLGGQKNWDFAAEAHRRALAPLDPDLVSQMTRFDFSQYLPEDILVKVDRASMLASLELRAPFLDHRLVEFAFAKVPTGLKTRIDQRKIMLKALAQRVLPQGFDLVRKQGFSIPLASWLENPSYRDFFSATLNESQGSPFNRRYVQSILDGQAKGRSNSERLFALVMFELWRKEYGLCL